MKRIALGSEFVNRKCLDVFEPSAQYNTSPVTNSGSLARFGRSRFASARIPRILSKLFSRFLQGPLHPGAMATISLKLEDPLFLLFR